MKAFLVLALTLTSVAAASPSFAESQRENEKQIQQVKKRYKHHAKKPEKPSGVDENCRFTLDYRCPTNGG